MINNDKNCIKSWIRKTAQDIASRTIKRLEDLVLTSDVHHSLA